jgi:3'(2'), 5'-bisphosphate nucleotidase
MSAPVPAVPVQVSEAALRRLVGIARDAGAAIMDWYRAGAEVTAKADGSPLTSADRAAHEVIDAALKAWDPSVPVVSEEGELPPVEERRNWRRFWLVDPLDGTKEFISRNGEFTVNIALIEDGEPVLGVVLAPALPRLWYAGRGLGAWSEDGSGTPVRIHSALRTPGEPLVVIESRSHPSERLERYLSTIAVAERIQAGSSLKFCLVAEGKADIYPRFGPTMEWDVAAGDCIFRNSGRDALRRSSLRYNQPDLRNGDFILGA